MDTSGVNRVLLTLVVVMLCVFIVPPVQSSLPPTTYGHHPPESPPPIAIHYHQRIQSNNTYDSRQVLGDDINGAKVTRPNGLHSFKLRQPISFDLINSSSQSDPVKNPRDSQSTSSGSRAPSGHEHGARHVREATRKQGGKRRWNKKRYKKRPNRRNNSRRIWRKSNQDGTRSGLPRPPHHRWSSKHQLASLDPRRAKVRRHLVRQHNLLRSQAYPTPGDMLAVTWYHTAAEQAQAWAEECDTHTLSDHPSVRWSSRYGACGQNVFISPTKKRWSHVLSEWWGGHQHFQYGGDDNNVTLVASYTQMAWYNSHQVGCGFAQCSTTGGALFFRYVCNYCPAGNDPDRLNRPYMAGTKCSQCPHSCKSPCYRRTCYLCTNACNYSDLWLNCGQLNQAWHEWLCNTKTKQGVERFKNCRATCQCVNEIT